MSMFFIGMGLASTASRGFRGMATGRNQGEKAKDKAEKPKANKNWKLTFEEVQLIRSLDEQGVKRRQIFEQHVEGKMSYEGMMNILNYITRVYA